ncbi:MAG: hypothetical protein AAFV46_02695 [Cyanobacteria bacterium J06635_11]
MDSIQVQASKLWDLIFSDETADTYQKTLNLTGTILKESAQLIWLIICSVFVFGAWFSDTSVKTGKGIRDWVDTQSSGGTAEEGKPIAETSKELLEKGRTGVTYLLNQAREQLGLEAMEAPPAKPAAAKKKAPAAAAKPVAETKAATPAAAKPAAAPVDAKPAAAPSEEITREPIEDDSL